MYSVHYTVYTVHCKVYSVQCTVFTVRYSNHNTEQFKGWQHQNCNAMGTECYRTLGHAIALSRHVMEVTSRHVTRLHVVDLMAHSRQVTDVT